MDGRRIGHQLPGRYVIEDDQREELGAFVLPRIQSITDAFDKYRVDVIRNNSPDDMRARELRAQSPGTPAAAEAPYRSGMILGRLGLGHGQ